jgi:hypothetical protein
VSAGGRIGDGGNVSGGSDREGRPDLCSTPDIPGSPEVDNVIRFPTNWLSTDDLVPFGPSAERKAALAERQADGERPKLRAVEDDALEDADSLAPFYEERPPPDLPPVALSADDFWGEDSGSLHQPLAPVDLGRSAAVPAPRRGRARDRWLSRAGAVCVALVLIAAVVGGVLRLASGPRTSARDVSALSASGAGSHPQSQAVIAPARLTSEMLQSRARLEGLEQRAAEGSSSPSRKVAHRRKAVRARARRPVKAAGHPASQPATSSSSTPAGVSAASDVAVTYESSGDSVASSNSGDSAGSESTQSQSTGSDAAQAPAGPLGSGSVVGSSCDPRCP